MVRIEKGILMWDTFAETLNQVPEEILREWRRQNGQSEEADIWSDSFDEE